MRIGCYVTPINWHLTADEAGYIVADCDATALFATARLGRRGRRRWATTSPPSPPASASTATCPASSATRTSSPASTPASSPDQREGGWMFYSSGTTGQAEGHPAAAARRRPRRQVVPHHAARRPVRLHQRRRVPEPGAAVPRRPGGLDDRHAAPRRHRGRDGALRSARAAGRHRAPPHHPRAARADPHDPAAQAHRGGALALRPVEPADGRARRGAVPGRGEAGDASTGSARSSTSSTAAARAPASATSARRTGSPTPARSASR